MTKLGICYEALRVGLSETAALTVWLGDQTDGLSPRYDLMPLPDSAKMGEGVLSLATPDTQQHEVPDLVEGTLRMRDSFEHNRQRILWIHDNCQDLWNVHLNGRISQGWNHIVWSFRNPSDAILFKLTWSL